jgi:DNA (cytosine-5)-methyltransferase 1
MLNGLDLFSGIGGLSIALAPWVRSFAYCENDRYAQSVLLERMQFGDIPCGPIWDDVRTLEREALPMVPDIVYGGFPCQDISVAGHGDGLDGERSRLYWEIHRIIKECKPAFIFLENVPAIRTRGALEVAESLTALGYDQNWDVISALEVGASFLGERWFCLAAADSQTLRE